MKAPFKTPVEVDFSYAIGSLVIRSDEGRIMVVGQPDNHLKFIATAINSHEALVEALGRMLNDYEDTYGENFCECDEPVNVRCSACYARDALAKGEPK